MLGRDLTPRASRTRSLLVPKNLARFQRSRDSSSARWCGRARRASNKMEDGHEQGEAGDRGGDWRVILCRGVERDDREDGRAGERDHRCLATALSDEWHIDDLRPGALPIALRRRAPDRLPQSSYQVDMVSWHR